MKTIKEKMQILLERNAALEKELIAKSREIEIEAALEKVRSRSLAMHTSNEVKEVITVVMGQLTLLGFHLDLANFNFRTTTRDWSMWLATPDYAYPDIILLPYIKHPLFDNPIEAAKKGLDFMSDVLNRDEFNTAMKHFYHTTILRDHDNAERKKYVAESKGLARSIVFLKHTILTISNFQAIPYTEDQNSILRRFANVFEQAYVRFLDLQKAEEQVKEAKIETALESVRASSMAMHHSDELEKVVKTLSDKLIDLGLSLDGALIFFFEKEKRNLHLWIATNQLPAPIKVDLPFVEDIQNNPIIRNLWKAIETGRDFINESYSGKAKDDYFGFVSKYNQSKIPEAIRKFQIEAESWTFSSAAGKNSIVGIDSWSGKFITQQGFQVLKRFAKVFEQAYTRFLDLQKAEAQAREAQIELALERVRARTMAMQKSDELLEISSLLFQQVKELGVTTIQNSIGIVNEGTGFVELSTTIHGSHLLHALNVPVDDPYLMAKAITAWKAKCKSLTLEFDGQELKNYNEHRNSFFETKVNFPEDRWIVNISFFSKGWLSFSTDKNVSGEIIVVLKRFAAVFEQTYTRFLDLQKAESQTREAQINLAIERVRAKALAMHKSDEIHEVVYTLRHELFGLNLEGIIGATICLQQPNGLVRLWDITDVETTGRYSWDILFDIDHIDSRLWVKRLWNSQEHIVAAEQDSKDIKRTLKWLAQYDQKMAADITALLKSNQITHAWHRAVKLADGILITDFANESPAEIEPILLKIGAAFDLAYTRFLDLQKAEAQVRESEIQLALERIRSISLAMHHTSELQELAHVVAQQLQQLGVNSNGGVFITINKEVDQHFQLWASLGMADYMEKVNVPVLKRPIFTELREAIKKGDTIFDKTYSKEQKDEMFRHLFQFAPWNKLALERKNELLSREGGLTRTASISQNTSIVITNHNGQRFSAEEIAILKRFGYVFEQAYTRFLDLQKAEAQAREARIEAALESVRASSMAMHHSVELEKVVKTLSDKLIEIGLSLDGAHIFFYEREKRILHRWIATNRLPAPIKVILPFDEDIQNNLVIRDLWNALDGVEEFINHTYSGKVKEDYFRYVGKYNELVIPEAARKFNLEAKTWTISYAAEKNSALAIDSWSDKLITQQDFQVLKRFAKVFEQSYIRFLDLKKAESQAREARIEAGLERVRYKAMAMQSSEDVGSATAAVFHEISLLKMETMRCGTVIFNPNNTAEVWAATTTAEGKEMKGVGSINLLQHPLWIGLMNAWEEKKDNYSYRLEGDDLKAYYAVLANSPNYKAPYLGDEMPDHYFYASYFNEGAIFSFSLQPYSPENQRILSKFTAVFSLTFRRYQDLQKAEAQAREAKIEASLERVRGKAMAMHNSQDLADTIGVFYRELQSFSITPRRCGVGLLNKESKEGELFTWNTTEQGESLELVGKMKMKGHAVLENVYNYWLTQTEYHPVLRGNEIKEYNQVIRPMMAFPDYRHNEVQYGYFFFFNEGGVYAWSEKEMNEDELQIYRRFTSVLSLTYKRYKDLKQAEALAQQSEEDLIKLQTEKKRAEEALTELKATQTQLIQSEKMASLGELTAGIAHEIQNPLNFVNNFSEINVELLDEMEEAVLKSDREEIISITADIKENLQKIVHHGKRADAIVKGMLQHSRSSSGKKEPTDINALCDEYFRLSYHGLRAKDKSFNASMKTDYDNSMGTVNIIPQDIGRVVLNLLTNAFYVVDEKRKSDITDYEPTVSISTKKKNDTIEIKVSDNGNGIPQKILDKIFQPFFTTKPTGQGTGLGLSLSYDIVKAHGGELKVETIDGNGTTFIIQIPKNS